jgi:hypothetical protein
VLSRDPVADAAQTAYKFRAVWHRVLVRFGSLTDIRVEIRGIDVRLVPLARESNALALSFLTAAMYCPLSNLLCAPGITGSVANWVGSNERIPGYVVRDAVCYASAMDPLHATIEEFAADGYTHVDCYCPRRRMTRLRPISWLPRISLGLTIAQLSARLRCAEGGASP